MIDLRLRRRTAAAELEAKQGKILGDEDYNLLLTGPSFVRMPDNRPLCVYLPGVLRAEVDSPGMYEVLHSLHSNRSINRGAASGSKRIRYTHSTRSKSLPVASAAVGAMEGTGAKSYCRLTSWTGRNLPQWRSLQPLLQEVARRQRQYVPGRAEAQQAAADATDPAWVVPGTPFTTITVNNTFATGVHTDRGDLDAGFSAIAVLRRGDYSGGRLVFPEYRVAVDLGHGDLILMDAHQWHGNTALVCACGEQPNGWCHTCGAERISVVSYFRTRVQGCGTPEQELRRADKAVPL